MVMLKEQVQDLTRQKKKLEGEKEKLKNEAETSKAEAIENARHAVEEEVKTMLQTASLEHRNEISTAKEAIMGFVVGLL